MLYSGYASTIREIVPPDIDIHGYADDHAIKMSFDGSSRTEEKACIQRLEDLTAEIKSWMDKNRLKMNNEKTEFILIGSPQQLRKSVISEANININGETIHRSASIKYLGVDLDERLSLDMINRKCRTAMGNLQKLKKKPYHDSIKNRSSRSNHFTFRLCQCPLCRTAKL